MRWTHRLSSPLALLACIERPPADAAAVSLVLVGVKYRSADGVRQQRRRVLGLEQYLALHSSPQPNSIKWCFRVPPGTVLTRHSSLMVGESTNHPTTLRRLSNAVGLLSN